jgi:hypothetical protein
MVAIAAKDGEIAKMVERYDCGIAIEPGDAEALAHMLTLLSREPLRCAEMGCHARDMLDAHFSRRQAFEHWQSALAIFA